MLTKLANLSEKITVSHPMIDQWLASRRQLLVAYYQLVELTTKKNSNEICDDTVLNTFCASLVDYLSSGHFKHYQQIEMLLASQDQLKIISAFYPQLETSTDTLLALHDTYLEPAISKGEVPKLREAISQVGLHLDSLFDLEDQMLLSTELVTSQQTQPTLASAVPMPAKSVQSQIALSTPTLDS
ncbi:Rsd/AlgQ family anti-sigma factor [Tatumella sp. TA1]|uniref:Rsd/AlgQ family anti-sigma factor n=1 Tax=Rosenbergiella collisarenosi TaxID=1544695 RepID=UPI0008F9016D|nr:Rsd/AlgQ family anti-sigma factor [Rosenbergiella collisarenosi]QGX90256.1 Rsd/AlgQ family anti-sigma factor [Tatumella sp. TA1]